MTTFRPLRALAVAALSTLSLAALANNATPAEATAMVKKGVVCGPDRKR